MLPRAAATIRTAVPPVVPTAFTTRHHRFGTSSSSLHAQDGGQPARKRRVRKDAAEQMRPPAEDEPVVQVPPPPQQQQVLVEQIELKPRNDNMVEFKIQDVRDVVSGKAEVTEETEEDEEDEDEWEYVDVDEEEDNDEYEYAVVDSAGKTRDSLEQLLADAKSFRVAEKEKDKEDKENEDEEGGISIPKSVSGAISTIVTIDFFVVIALLVWFLAGIFGQYVLKDESIQIAFNNIFEPVVQPALGILMIGSAAGAMFRKDEDEEY